MQTRLSPIADRVLRELEGDPSTNALVAAIYDTIERLVDNPGAAEMRRHRFRPPDGMSLWLVKIPNRLHDREPHILLWERAGDGTGDLLIAYIGPDDFRPGK